MNNTSVSLGRMSSSVVIHEDIGYQGCLWVGIRVSGVCIRFRSLEFVHSTLNTKCEWYCDWRDRIAGNSRCMVMEMKVVMIVTSMVLVGTR